MPWYHRRNALSEPGKISKAYDTQEEAWDALGPVPGAAGQVFYSILTKSTKEAREVLIASVGRLRKDLSYAKCPAEVIPRKR